eukprot:GGOE01001087.1.p2 GENE.GGOE01001087.1~~GGOE01001087.1.p2  ORF type:complete len:114 (-),score=5.25 GGOE01001087.1:503-844(-)
MVEWGILERHVGKQASTRGELHLEVRYWTHIKAAPPIPPPRSGWGHMVHGGRCAEGAVCWPIGFFLFCYSGNGRWRWMPLSLPDGLVVYTTWIGTVRKEHDDCKRLCLLSLTC